MATGSLRCDVNVSMNFTHRTEIKNVNTLNGLKKSIIYESNRLKHGKLNNETRMWDEISQTTRFIRLKQTQADYSYIEEFDIPDTYLPDHLLSKWQRELPEYPQTKEARYELMGLRPIDIKLLTSFPEISTLFDQCTRLEIKPNTAIKWIKELLEILRENKQDPSMANSTLITAPRIAELVGLTTNRTLSPQNAKRLFPLLVYNHTGSILDLAHDEQMIDTTSADQLTTYVSDALRRLRPLNFSDVKLARRCLGEIMKTTGRRSDPIRVKEEIVRQIMNGY